MIKRTIFYTFFILVLTSVMIISFRYFQPKNEKGMSSFANINDIDYLELNEFNEYITKNQDVALNVIFYQDNDVNSQYLFNDLLPQVYEEYGITSLDKVIYVQLQDSDYKDKPSFASTYGFSKVPALINLTYSSGTITINNILVDTDTLLINHDSLVEWLQLNEIVQSSDEE